VVSEKTLSHPDLELIVSHENIHVREKHTFDILFTEIMFLFQWFNPFAWLIKDAVKNNLEYLTDDEIAKKYNPQTYQMAMLTLTDKQGIAPFLTALNGSQLKNRIVMMKKKKENKYAILKQMAVLPLLAVLIMGLANREVKTEYIQSDKKTDLVIDGKSIPTDHPAIPSVDNQKNFDSGEIATLMNVGDKVISTTMVIDDSFTTSEKEFMVSGKVTDNKGQPLSGVSILIKGKTLETTTTDTKGNYEIKSESEIELLVFGKDGYETLEVKPGGSKNIDVKLEVENKLYIVDGKAYEGEMSEINASNIESIDILKGESGFELYGDKGRNGAVLITTKNGSNDKRAKINTNDTIQPPKVVKILKYGDEDLSQALYLVDGEEVKNLEDVDSQNVEKVKVLKPNAAVSLYGEKGKNGVVLISTKNDQKTETAKITGNPIVIVDGQLYDSMEDANVPPEDIASVSVLKGETASPKIYGEKARNGVIIINTKTKYNSDKAEPLIVVNGKESNKKVNDIDSGTIQSVNILKDEKATEKYGDKGKNGVIEITLKTGNEDSKITTQLELRRFIAGKIKYPVEAQENNQQGVVEVWAFIAKDGTISKISEKRPDGKFFNIDEVMVTSLKSEKTVTSEKSKDLALLVKESKRVIGQLSTINIPEFAGETVCFRIRFVLE
jgi:hypothetical protein